LVPVDDRLTPVIELRRLVEEFVRERNWDGYHSPKNLATSISIEAAELMELFQWVTTAQSSCVDDETLRRVKDELADVLIYCLSLANRLNIDIAAAVETKMMTNRTRFPADGFAPPGPASRQRQEEPDPC
jgi:NTP pyrophosphatase (non-canonical NTP hydrolase)